MATSMSHHVFAISPPILSFSSVSCVMRYSAALPYSAKILTKNIPHMTIKHQKKLTSHMRLQTQLNFKRSDASDALNSYSGRRMKGKKVSTRMCVSRPAVKTPGRGSTHSQLITTGEVARGRWGKRGTVCNWGS